MSQIRIDFVCKQCGICCSKFSPTLTIEDMQREPRLWQFAILRFFVKNKKTREYMLEKKHYWAIAKIKKGDPCPFQINNLCSIHETRPQICRDYPMEAQCYREEQCLQLEK